MFPCLLNMDSTLFPLVSLISYLKFVGDTYSLYVANLILPRLGRPLGRPKHSPRISCVFNRVSVEMGTRALNEEWVDLDSTYILSHGKDNFPSQELIYPYIK